LFGFSVFYYFVILGTQKTQSLINAKEEEIKLKQEEREEELEQKRQEDVTKNLNEQNLTNCLGVVEKNKSSDIIYWIDWGKQYCEQYVSDVSLHNYCLGNIEKKISEVKAEEELAKKDCYKRFPQ
jgi:hypothetical protein